MMSQYQQFLHGVHPEYKAAYFDKTHGFSHDVRHRYVSIPVAPPYISRIMKIALYPVPVKEADLIRVMMPGGKFVDYSIKDYYTWLQEGKIPHPIMTQFVVYDGPYWTPHLGLHRMVATEEIIQGRWDIGRRRKRAWNHILPNGVEISYSQRYGAPGIGVFKTTSMYQY